MEAQDPQARAREMLYRLSDRELKEFWALTQELRKSTVKDAQQYARSFLPTRKCAWRKCGQDFVMRNSLSMYCCHYHKQLAYQERKAAKLRLVGKEEKRSHHKNGNRELLEYTGTDRD